MMIRRGLSVFLVFSAFSLFSRSFCEDSINSSVSISGGGSVVEINIRLKSDGQVEVLKTQRPLGNPERRVVFIKDSDTGLPVVSANVEIDGKWNVPTGDEGKAFLPDALDDGTHSMVVSKGAEYVPTESDFTLRDGELSEIPQISIPKKVDYERIKIVLDWGEFPRDLDAHVFVGERHVSFSSMNSEGIRLDRDDTESFGPETITVQGLEDETLSYFVENYSDRSYPRSNALSASGAQVRVFRNNTLLRTFKIEGEAEGITWHVFDIVGGEIVERGEILKERL